MTMAAPRPQKDIVHGLPRNVAVIVGSLRKASLNRKLALAIAALAPPTLKLSIVEIGDLPLFNEEWEANPPKPAADFKAAIQAADAVLFVTPSTTARCRAR